ncbi:DnaJ-domain-containing protein [Stereum hirsutum FP-91666 SS1]|uniref:DnaJ-domain-containing protein n=1 Tax=Stereum hirsutum (strain FP-91666) TaxID=721885 RepID=UPI000444954E|nr:DnaJ-domain-containing protein [Stereum hirsutum FP-91666 SS1]EIM82620.1 DnaJ-domain-containing protein [Stereum hirsutum FP-91666 SS1]
MEDEPLASEEETQNRPAAADRTYTESTDLYEVLGVSKTATTAEIKTAFRAKALGHHPDKNMGADDDYEGSNERFRRIREAYEILTDDKEREQYDRDPAAFASTGNRAQGSNDDDDSDWFSGWSFGGSGPRPASQSSGWRMPRRAPNEIGRQDLFDLIQRLELKLKSGISSDERYRVIGAFFDTLAKDDARQSKRNLNHYPSYGDAHSVWSRSACTKEELAALDTRAPEVCYFYGFWNKFVSSKGFEWVMRYDEEYFHQFGNARLDRHIRKENKRVQAVYHKEFNEIIRVYTMVLRDSDSRYDDHLARMERRRASPSYSDELERQKKREKEKKKERKKRSKSSW